MSTLEVESKTTYYFYGSKLRAARREAGLGQQQLAARLTIAGCPRPISHEEWSQQTISYLEKTTIPHLITPEQIRAFNRALDPADDLG
ncbi:unnamed protein product [marine sediment metagenome]|uniref:HTH cro/C1-type domain-containing protein n=1 Tax=marine sediment metagenome TaxID=412755 RepID=X0XZR6_9ZZZZ